MTLRRLAAAGAAFLLLAAQPALSAEARDPAAPADGKLGFVLTSRYHAVYETPDRQECPDGLQSTLLEQYRAAYPTDEARKAHDEKFAYYANLGPNGENVFFSPTSFTDPLPFKVLKSKVALGLNLDGKTGEQDFTGPAGEPGVDNQLYRVMGCISGFRTKGAVKETANNFMRISPYNRIVLEVTGVDSLVNDPQVTVSIHRGLDPVAVDGSNKAIPWRTQRIDTVGAARFEARLNGRIVDGYLVTEPTDVVLPAGPQPQTASEQAYRQMRLRLKLTDTTAEGLMGGYDDVEAWYRTQVKFWGAGSIAEFNHFSPSTLYAALNRYADAFPDPATGRNTAISSAYVVKFVRAMLVWPDSQTARAAAAPRPLTSGREPERVVQEPMPAGVKLLHTGYGFVHAAADGRTLYTWGGDVPGKSRCADARIVAIQDGIGTGAMTAEADKRPTCQQVWPPLAAPAGFRPLGKWSAIARADGSQQLAYAGQPLYTSVLDKAPGDLNGWGQYGIGNASGRIPLWARLDAPPQVEVVPTALGRVLATASGMSLYILDEDPKRSPCEDACAKTWPPFLAGELAQASADWSLVERTDGARQWAYRGRPLHTFVGDERQTDTGGNGIGKWRAALLQALPTPPPAVHKAMSTAGEVLTDKHGKTLYRFLCTEYSPDRLNCDGPDSTQLYRLSICGGPEKCGQTWRYLPAEGPAPGAGGVWSVVSVDPVSGVFCTNRAQTCTQRVWAYYGRPVYTFAGDLRPGDIAGDQIRTFPFGFVRMRPDGKVEP
ncbi:MAG: hypothetical protein JWQ29_1520 [Phenylobacterium sp.]|nr:hypothetical protein [Phenylobacterium sp.]